MAKPIERIDLSLNKFMLDFPGFYEAHFRSYERFLEEGIREALEMVNPITDTLEKMWKLEFLDYYFKEPPYTLEQCLDYDLTYAKQMFVKVRLTSLKTGESQTQDVYFADIPVLTEGGYFVVNGVVRMVRLQIVRSEGVIFHEGKNVAPGAINRYVARLIPRKGGWYMFDISRKGVITVALLRQRVKVLYTTLLKALKGYTNSEIEKLFADVDKKHGYIKATLEHDKAANKEEAIMQIYSKLRPNEQVTLDRANRYIRGFFFNTRRFYLGPVGRYQLNQKLGLTFSEPKIHVKDLVEIGRHLIKVNNGEVPPDDVDSLMNRRIRTVGEILQEVMEEAMIRFERNVKDRMSRKGADAALKPAAFVHTKVVTAQLTNFLGLSALSKFMEQQNIYGHIEELRRVTAKGPGGLTGKNAGISVRNIHSSHYSRLGPVTSPEGLNAGLITHLAIFARVNKYGFIEAPFRRLKNKVKNKADALENRILAEDLEVKGKTIKKGTFIDKKLAKQIASGVDKKEIKVYPFLTDKVDYFSYHEEMEHYIGLSTAPHDEYGNYLPGFVTVRHNGEFMYVDSSLMDYVDVRAWQIGSLGLTLIPFADRTYPYRAMMASNMQRQAVPLVFPKAARVGTGIESLVAKHSGKMVYAEDDGVVLHADANYVVVKYKNGKKREYKVDNFVRTNDNTVVTQKVRVVPGEKVKKGDILVDGPSMDHGELALGRDVLVAVMPYEGLNYEDGFVVSERLLKDDVFTSLYIKLYTQDLRETKVGPEILTADIPNVNYKLLRNLTSEGVVRVGSIVEGGDILAGIVSQKAEKQLTPEEVLLRAVFGESAKEVKNNSLRMPHGSRGVVIKTQVLSREDGISLPAGVLKRVKVWVAELKRVSYGDKFAGFYGDKGTVARIVPEEDMPFLEDGTPVDVVMTPLLVKRMNLGILYQIMYSTIAEKLGIHIAVPNFEPHDTKWVEDAIRKIGWASLQKQKVYDGKTGKPFDNVVTVGYRNFMRLKHIASDKMHARSTGPYSVVTQQPVGGKSHMGGMRFGEMEVWVLEAHGAAYTLQEMLTIKSDDVRGRTAAYKAILQGEKVKMENVPETFNVLLRELNALAVRVDVETAKLKDKMLK